MTDEKLNKKRGSKLDGLLVPDGGWGWVICLATFACNFLVTGINISSGILLVGFLHTFHESVTKTSLVLATLNGLTLMIGPLGSGLLSFCSHRQIIIGASLIGSLTMFVSVYVPSIDIMIFTFGFVGGISLGMIFFAANVIVGLYFTKRRGLAVGLATAGGGLGTFLMNFGIEKLLGYYSLRGTLLMLSGFILNVVVFGALCRPLKYRKISPKENNALASSEQNDDDEKEDMLKEYQAESVTHKDISSDTNGRCMTLWKYIFTILDFSLLKNSDVILLLIIFFLWAATMVVMMYLPLYSISVGLSTADGALIMSIVGIGCTVGQLLIGVLLHIFHMKSDHLLTLAMGLMGLTTVAIPLVSDIYFLGALIVIWSIAVGFGVALRVILIVDMMGVEHLASVYSFLLFSNGIGYGIFPPLFGWLYDLTKSFLVIFNLTAGLFFLSLIFTFTINCQLKKRASKKTSHRVNEVTENGSDVR